MTAKRVADSQRLRSRLAKLDTTVATLMPRRWRQIHDQIDRSVAEAGRAYIRNLAMRRIHFDRDRHRELVGGRCRAERMSGRSISLRSFQKRTPPAQYVGETLPYSPVIIYRPAVIPDLAQDLCTRSRRKSRASRFQVLRDVFVGPELQEATPKVLDVFDWEHRADRDPYAHASGYKRVSCLEARSDGWAMRLGYGDWRDVRAARGLFEALSLKMGAENVGWSQEGFNRLA